MKKRNEKDKGLNIPSYPPLGTPINPFGPFIADPLGSYTGRAANPHEIPVQDADDL